VHFKYIFITGLYFSFSKMLCAAFWANRASVNKKIDVILTAQIGFYNCTIHLKLHSAWKWSLKSPDNTNSRKLIGNNKTETKN